MPGHHSPLLWGPGHQFKARAWRTHDEGVSGHRCCAVSCFPVVTKPGTERPGDLLHSCWWGPEPGVAAPEASPWAAQAPRPSLRTPGSPHYCLRSRGPPAPGEPEDRSPHVLLPTPRLRSLRGDAGLKGTEVGGGTQEPRPREDKGPGGRTER